MPTQTDPVSENEYVYRKVLKQWHDAFPPFPDARIDRQAFRPTPDDTTGLSVSRALFVEPEQLDRDKNGNPGRYYIARLHVEKILGLGLSVEPDPMDWPPGHALIPEIRYGLKGQEKKWSKNIQLELARLASEDIVYAPPT